MMLSIDDCRLGLSHAGAPRLSYNPRKKEKMGMDADNVASPIQPGLTVSFRYRKKGESHQRSALALMEKLQQRRQRGLRAPQVLFTLDRGYGSWKFFANAAAKNIQLTTIINSASGHYHPFRDPCNDDDHVDVAPEIANKNDSDLSEHYLRTACLDNCVFTGTMPMHSGRYAGPLESRAATTALPTTDGGHVLVTGLAVRDRSGGSSGVASTTLIRFMTSWEDATKYVNTYVYEAARVNMEDRKQTLFWPHGAGDPSHDVDVEQIIQSDDESDVSSANEFPGIGFEDAGDAVFWDHVPRALAVGDSDSDGDTVSGLEGDCDIALTHSNNHDGEENQDNTGSSMDSTFGTVWPAGDVPNDTGNGELKLFAEAALKITCNVLTIGQRCFDWAILRRFHLTGTTTGHLFSRLSTWKKARAAHENATRSDAPATSCNERLRAWAAAESAVWMMARKSWCDSHSRSSDTMKAGHDNECDIVDLLRSLPRVHGVWSVGLVEHKQCPQLAVSPDAIAVLRDCESLGCESNCMLAVVEIKTKVATATVHAAKRLASEMRAEMHTTWAEVPLWSQAFKKYVPNQLHRHQITHQIVVTGATVCIFVVAEMGSIIYMVTVKANSVGIDEHRKKCNELIQMLGMSWPFTSDSLERVHISNKVPVALRADFLSHYWLWKSMRAHVIRLGPFQPIHKLFHSFQTMYNLLMGGVDACSQRLQVLRFNEDMCPPWPAHLVMRAAGLCAVNAWHAYRLQQFKRHLSTREAFKSLRQFRKTMNRGITFKGFIRQVGLNILLNPRSTGLAGRARQGATSRGRNNDNGPAHNVRMRRSEERFQRLQEVASRNSYGKASWFNSTEGKELRFWDGLSKLHIPSKRPHRRRCAYCNLLRRESKTQRRTSYCCSVCGVHLCTQRRLFPTSVLRAGEDGEVEMTCFDMWHQCQDLPVSFTGCVFGAREAGDHDGSDGSTVGITSDEERPGGLLTAPRTPSRNAIGVTPRKLRRRSPGQPRRRRQKQARTS